VGPQRVELMPGELVTDGEPERGGEIEAARHGALPTLVTVADLRGDLHTHTDLTDGTASLETMVSAAAARGAGTAQRGWLTPADVINTWPLDRLTAFLRPSQ